VTVAASLALAAAACAISLLATPVAARVASRVGLLDRPGALKPHARPTPYLGGVGVGCGVALGAAWFDPRLLIPFGLALALGTADDARPLPPALRLLGQAGVGIVLAAIVATRFGGAAYVLVPLATVVLINGCNLIDGLDALCGAVTITAAVGFGLVLTGDARGLALALAGATAAFLVFNRPPAKIYLGDGGSYLIGVSLTALLALTWGPGEHLATGIGALALVFLPAAEVAFAVLRRRRAGRSFLVGDRDHPYDVLVRSGWSVERTVGAYALLEAVLVAVAVVAAHLRTQLAWAVVGTAALMLLAIGFATTRAFPAPRPADGVSP
jgi:UDP-N-acetylmuramyl pentapeptide phosphotransferase/UDP-N-acetylglucosamine-1-phosphate transferase